MRRPRRPAAAIVGLGVSVALLVGAAPAAAGPEDRKREVDQGIVDLEHELEGTAAELQAAYASLQTTQARLPQAEAELKQAEDTRSDAQRKDAELAGRLEAAQESQALAQDAVAQGSEAIEGTESTIGQIASRTYRGAGLAPELSIVLDASSPEDFAQRYVMVDTALRSQNGALARLQQQQAVRANAQARLDAVKAEVQRLREEAAANLEVARQAEADAAARKKEIEELAAQQQQATAVIEARKAEEMARLDQLQQERTALEAELRRLAEIARQEAEARARAKAAAEAAARAQAEAAARASRSRPAPPAPAPAAEAPSGSTLAKPVNAPVTSHYGYRIHPIYKTRRLHGGTDFGAACGTPVRSGEDGTVVRAGVNGGFGNQVVINHGVLRGEGVSTSYNHLSGYAVTSGSVSRGQVIGYIGTTGTSTGCHLHFEVYVNGSTTDPMGWL